MYKHFWLTNYRGPDSNQEIYEILKDNIPYGMFDSVTINVDQSRVSCIKNGDEIFAINNANSGCYVYFKISNEPNPRTIYSKEANTGSNRDFYDISIRGIHITTNAILLDIISKNYNNYFNYSNSDAMIWYSVQYFPSIAFINKSDDIICIKMNYFAHQMNNAQSPSTFSNSYFVSSYKYGAGETRSRNFYSYYQNFSNSVILNPVICTNSKETPVPGVYWLRQIGNKNTGICRIGGKEYFTNGVFCILNE